MLEAERWYKYQSSYQKYGFDMKPQTERDKDRDLERQRRLEKGRRQKKKKMAKAMAVRDRLSALVLLTMAGIVLTCVVASVAYAAQIKYDINMMAKESEALEGEIENLQVKIKSKSSISIVEARALYELGMVYPSFDQYIYLDEAEKPVGDFVLAIKEMAYN